MSLKHAISALTAAMTITLSSALWAQTAADESAAAQAHSRTKVEEATAADEKFHADRTQANMLARDKAEAEAAAAVQKSNAAQDTADTARESEAKAGSPR